MAHRIKEKGAVEPSASGGLEGLLDGFAWAVLILGCIGALFALFVTRGYGWVGSLLAIFSAGIGWVVLRALAEIIRLQKHAAGLPYGGNISTPAERNDSMFCWCSNCNAMLHNRLRCDACGEAIEPEENTDSVGGAE